ncbi:MAG: aldehyde dehydrogenase family protein [Desulfuromonadaceae bacterium]
MFFIFALAFLTAYPPTVTTKGFPRHRLGGTFFEPTIMADVTSEMLVAREETFVPVGRDACKNIY